MKKRDIAICVILSIVTCGIYSIIWFYNITNDVVKLNNGKEYNTSGGKAILFTLITCGIYMIYWYYKVGKSIYVTQVDRGIAATDNSVLYLLLGVFGLGIVSTCLVQNEINNLIVE